MSAEIHSICLKSIEARYRTGVLIRSILAERKIQQTALAKRIGILPSYLSQVLSGRKALTPKTAIRLEKALNVNAMELLAIQNEASIQSLLLKRPFIAEIEPL